jgi:hypothetical protein
MYVCTYVIDHVGTGRDGGASNAGAKRVFKKHYTIDHVSTGSDGGASNAGAKSVD